MTNLISTNLVQIKMKKLWQHLVILNKSLLLINQLPKKTKILITTKTNSKSNLLNSISRPITGIDFPRKNLTRASRCFPLRAPSLQTRTKRYKKTNFLLIFSRSSRSSICLDFRTLWIHRTFRNFTGIKLTKYWGEH